MASFPSRCHHIKINGTQCGSPALRRNRFCYFHKRFQDERIRLGADRARRGVATFILPVFEDANSIQIALMQVTHLLLRQQIDHKTAALLLYALQTASTNLRMTKFEPNRHDVVLDPRTVGETLLNENVWADEDFDEDDDDDDDDEEEENNESEDDDEDEDEEPELIVAQKKITQATNPHTSPNPAANGEKKPAASQTMESIQETIRDKIRRGLIPPSSLPSTE